MARKKKRKNPPEPMTHNVPWHPPVVAFRKGSTIREAFAQWWEPHYSSELSHFLHGIAPRSSCSDGVDDAFMSTKTGGKARGAVPGKTVKVRISLDYPLNEARERVIEVSTKRFGEIFGAAHDLYREIYQQDDAEWKKAGKKVPPKVGRVKILGMKGVLNMVNRASGRLVWGHDMTDLVFEFMNFDFSPEARKAFDAYQEVRDVELKKLKKARKVAPRSGRGSVVLATRLNQVKLKFDVKKHVLGTVTFGIGS